MWNMAWPIMLIVLCNCVYNICTKEVPSEANALAALTVTYAVAAVFTLVAFLLTKQGSSVVGEFAKLNWSSLVLGVVIVGLEFGYIFAFRVGWKMSLCSLVANVTLAAVLVLVGFLLYHERITLMQVAGIFVCVVGLVLVTQGGGTSSSETVAAAQAAEAAGIAQTAEIAQTAGIAQAAQAAGAQDTAGTPAFSGVPGIFDASGVHDASAGPQPGLPMKP